MEGRLAAKLERASEASQEAAHQAKLNSEGLEQLESRVNGGVVVVWRESLGRLSEVSTKTRRISQSSKI